MLRLMQTERLERKGAESDSHQLPPTEVKCGRVFLPHTPQPTRLVRTHHIRATLTVRAGQRQQRTAVVTTYRLQGSKQGHDNGDQ